MLTRAQIEIAAKEAAQEVADTLVTRYMELVDSSDAHNFDELDAEGIKQDLITGLDFLLEGNVR